MSTVPGRDWIAVGTRMVRSQARSQGEVGRIINKRRPRRIFPKA